MNTEHIRASMLLLQEAREFAQQFELLQSLSGVHGLDLRGLLLMGLDLRAIALPEADLRGVNLSGSDLSHANLRGARLSDATLIGTTLHGADLRDVSGADWSGADLSGARLSAPVPVRPILLEPWQRLDYPPRSRGLLSFLDRHLGASGQRPTIEVHDGRLALVMDPMLPQILRTHPNKNRLIQVLFSPIEERLCSLVGHEGPYAYTQRRHRRRIRLRQHHANRPLGDDPQPTTTEAYLTFLAMCPDHVRAPLHIPEHPCVRPWIHWAIHMQEAIRQTKPLPTHDAYAQPWPMSITDMMACSARELVQQAYQRDGTGLRVDRLWSVFHVLHMHLYVVGEENASPFTKQLYDVLMVPDLPPDLRLRMHASIVLCKEQWIKGSFRDKRLATKLLSAF